MQPEQTSIVTACGVGKTTVTDTLCRASAANLSWPLPLALDDEGLETLLYPTNHSSSPHKYTQPDWHALNSEFVTHKNLTHMLLWQEYKEQEPFGYQYSQFCDLFRKWKKKLDLFMRQEHRAGEKLFVDYCGQTIPIVDPSTGEVRDAQVFVAVMGASNSMPKPPGLSRFLTGPVRTSEHFPSLVVCPNVSSLTIYSQQSPRPAVMNPI